MFPRHYFKIAVMLENYLKIAWRNLSRNRVFSFINILGLAIGLACFMLIAVYVYHELSFDRYSANAKNMYRIHLSVTGNGDIVVYPNVDVAVGEGIKNAFPEVKSFTRISPASDFVKYNDQQFKEKHLAFADSNFLQLFSIPLLEGNHLQKNILEKRARWENLYRSAYAAPCTK